MKKGKIKVRSQSARLGKISIQLKELRRQVIELKQALEFVNTKHQEAEAAYEDRCAVIRALEIRVAQAEQRADTLAEFLRPFNVIGITKMAGAADAVP